MFSISDMKNNDIRKKNGLVKTGNFLTFDLNFG